MRGAGFPHLPVKSVRRGGRVHRGLSLLLLLPLDAAAFTPPVSTPPPVAYTIRRAPAIRPGGNHHLDLPLRTLPPLLPLVMSLPQLLPFLQGSEALSSPRPSLLLSRLRIATPPVAHWTGDAVCACCLLLQYRYVPYAPPYASAPRARSDALFPHYTLETRRAPPVRAASRGSGWSSAPTLRPSSGSSTRHLVAN